MSSGFAKSNMGQPRKRRATIAKHDSSRGRFGSFEHFRFQFLTLFKMELMDLIFPGSRPWEADFEWEGTETDSYLAGQMSGLSFNESEEDEEDFIFLT